MQGSTFCVVFGIVSALVGVTFDIGIATLMSMGLSFALPLCLSIEWAAERRE